MRFWGNCDAFPLNDKGGGQMVTYQDFYYYNKAMEPEPATTTGGHLVTNSGFLLNSTAIGVKYRGKLGYLFGGNQGWLLRMERTGTKDSEYPLQPGIAKRTCRTGLLRLVDVSYAYLWHDPEHIAGGLKQKVSLFSALKYMYSVPSFSQMSKPAAHSLNVNCHRLLHFWPDVRCELHWDFWGSSLG